MDEEFLEFLGKYNDLTPIQKLELHEEIDRLTANGELIVIHGRKTQGRSVLHIIDRVIWPEEDTNHGDDSKGSA